MHLQLVLLAVVNSNILLKSIGSCYWRPEHTYSDIAQNQFFKHSPAHAHIAVYSSASFVHLQFFTQPSLHIHDTSSYQAFEASGN